MLQCVALVENKTKTSSPQSLPIDRTSRSRRCTHTTSWNRRGENPHLLQQSHNTSAEVYDSHSVTTPLFHFLTRHVLSLPFKGTIRTKKLHRPADSQNSYGGEAANKCFKFL